jgi:hypothetical protein
MQRRAAVLSWSALAATAATFLAPGAAHAYERQWHLGADLGYALEGDSAGLANGFGGGVHAAYGLSDAFNAMVDLDATYHPGGKTLVGSATAGVGYVFDVLRWVPYAGLMVGLYDVFDVAGGCNESGAPRCVVTRFGAAVPVGLDYQLSRSFAVGGQVKYNLIFLGAEVPVHYLSVFARAEYIWGY